MANPGASENPLSPTPRRSASNDTGPLARDRPGSWSPITPRSASSRGGVNRASPTPSLHYNTSSDSLFDVRISQGNRGGPLDDPELARRIQAGDEIAEDDFVRRFSPGLNAVARVRVGAGAAEDLAQEVLAAALVNLRRGDWRGEAPLAAYVATILRRLSRSRRSEPRLVALSREIPSAQDGPQVLAERAENRARVRAALSRLVPRYREVLVRHYLRSESVEIIGRALGLPRGTVLSRLHHGRRKLGRLLRRF